MGPVRQCCFTWGAVNDKWDLVSMHNCGLTLLSSKRPLVQSLDVTKCISFILPTSGEENTVKWERCCLSWCCRCVTFYGLGVEQMLNFNNSCSCVILQFHCCWQSSSRVPLDDKDCVYLLKLLLGDLWEKRFCFWSSSILTSQARKFTVEIASLLRGEKPRTAEP